jgi:superfamily I DNA/RNA helicase
MKSLVENEIGGVIEGSLSAALKKKPLDEEQYLEEKRSNIPINTEEGRDKRKLVYQDYSRYARWKIENNKYDLGDIVLELCKLLDLRLINDIFQSAYLDEVQDFSYASIFLICSIAGKSEAQWVAAGDTAQMISPGCSFTFAGLTQTLRSIRKDVVLRKVEQLRRNYRMTKGVLEVGNAILQALKTHFPGAIESPQPEIAMKDLGLKVALISWEDGKIESFMDLEKTCVR